MPRVLRAIMTVGFFICSIIVLGCETEKNKSKVTIEGPDEKYEVEYKTTEKH